MPIVDARQQALGATVFVTGVVTVEPGRILGDSVVAIQDDSGGIFVRLPTGAPTVAVGQALEVIGPLAAPYGNLEIRPTSTGIRVVGIGDVPAARSLAAAEIGEATEGLLARIEVVIDDVEASSSGSLTLLVHDEGGATRVFFHAPLGATAASFRDGQRIAAIGLVGDRLGLYRLWPRDRADVTLLAEPPSPTPRPTATPRPTTTPTPRPTATPSATPRPTVTTRPSATPTHSPSPAATSTPTPPASMSIADALRQQGATVSVAGVVTTRPGLLDADAQRVTIQDATGAILVRLPPDFETQPGRRLSVTGLIGTYYGAPQLTAATGQDQGAAQPEAAQLHAAPIAPAIEWRLVTVSGTIEFVHKDGDAWRAELTLSGGGMPIVGLERSGIPSTALETGRKATITGVVKRAYPTASDQRLAIVPRSNADIELGAAPQPSGHPGGSTPRPGSTSRPGSTPRPGTTPRATAHPSTRPSGSGATETLVGGSVKSVDGTIVVLAGASGDVTIELVGDAAPLAATLEPGDLVNASGTLGESGRLIVDDPAAVSRVPGLGGEAATQQAASPATHQPQTPAVVAPNPPQMAPIGAFAVILGLTVLLMIGAFAVKLYGPNRVRNWLNRLKSRFVRI